MHRRRLLLTALPVALLPGCTGGRALEGILSSPDCGELVLHSATVHREVHCDMGTEVSGGVEVVSAGCSRTVELVLDRPDAGTVSARHEVPADESTHLPFPGDEPLLSLEGRRVRLYGPDGLAGETSVSVHRPQVGSPLLYVREVDFGAGHVETGEQVPVGVDVVNEGEATDVSIELYANDEVIESVDEQIARGHECAESGISPTLTTRFSEPGVYDLRVVVEPSAADGYGDEADVGTVTVESAGGDTG